MSEAQETILVFPLEEKWTAAAAARLAAMAREAVQHGEPAKLSDKMETEQ